MLNLVLDHSALIPCGDKSKDEKKAIRILGDRLPELDTVWYVSAKYLKTLYSILKRELKHHHPLPRLQAGLDRTFLSLLEAARSKSWVCKPKPIKNIAEEFKLKLHVIARYAFNKIKTQLKSKLLDFRIDHENREVLAIAVEATRYSRQTLYIITTDTPLLKAISNLIQQESLKIEGLTPKQLLENFLNRDIIGQ